MHKIANLFKPNCPMNKTAKTKQEQNKKKKNISFGLGHDDTVQNYLNSQINLFSNNQKIWGYFS